MAILASKTVTFTENGIAVFSMVGVGGGGASGNNTTVQATGGNSAPWGRKRLQVEAGKSLVFTFGASVLSPATNSTNGTNGNTSTAAYDGVTILTVQGGEGGRFGTPATAATAAATVTGADYWVPGVRAGSATGSGATSGGAAVDLLGTGKGRSPDVTASNVPIGGSVGTDLGGAFISWMALSDWGLVITDPSLATSTYGVPGRGGQQSPSTLPGAFGGGGNQGGQTQAGYGGGGSGYGAGSGSGSRSGEAYAYLTFLPEA